MKQRKEHYFSLLELIVVIGVLLILVGIVIPHIGREPSYIIVDDSVNRIKKVFLQAANLSLTQGVEIKVLVNTKTRQVGIVNAKSEEKQDGGFSKSLYECTIHEGVAIRVLKEEEETMLDEGDYFDEREDDIEDIEDKMSGANYVFYPDGSADGPPIELDLQGESAVMRISPLTGMVTVKKFLDGQEVSEDGTEEEL